MPPDPTKPFPEPPQRPAEDEGLLILQTAQAGPPPEAVAVVEGVRGTETVETAAVETVAVEPGDASPDRRAADHTTAPSTGDAPNTATATTTVTSGRPPRLRFRRLRGLAHWSLRPTWRHRLPDAPHTRAVEVHTTSPAPLATPQTPPQEGPPARHDVAGATTGQEGHQGEERPAVSTAPLTGAQTVVLEESELPLTVTSKPAPVRQVIRIGDPAFTAAPVLVIPDPGTPRAERGAGALPGSLSAIDVFRGLTILEVVSHHATGMALRHAEEGSAAHLLFQVLNRTFHFAVPAFVFLSAVVLTRSLLKNFDPRRYFWRRLTRGAWPYLLWSALYMGWYVWTGQRPASTLTDPEKWQFYLLFGKASYHLYFLLVALEVYLILPLLLPLARRKPSISVVLVGGLAVQIGLYFLNREVLKLPYPASTALWYVLPILLGMSVGAHLGDFPEWWRKRRVVLLPALLVAYALYLPLALSYVRGQEVAALLYTSASWLFTSLMALTLLGVSYHLQRHRGPLQVMVALLGTVSLQVYLIHPAILQTLEQWQAPQGSPALIILTVLAYALTAVGLPAALGLVLLKTPISKLLFGR